LDGSFGVAEFVFDVKGFDRVVNCGAVNFGWNAVWNLFWRRPLLVLAIPRYARLLTSVILLEVTSVFVDRPSQLFVV
jgi:hypothetical protein